MTRKLSCGFGSLVFLSCILVAISIASGQEQERKSKPIDLDKELQPKVSQDRARSYYYYSIAKWYEGENEFARALVEMRNAVKYSEESSALRVELASLLEKTGNLHDALEEGKEAARLAPEDPEPHWLLANLYFRAQPRDKAAAKESMHKAIKELETMRDLAPQDERSHFALGGAYLELGDLEKGIKEYEAYQALMPTSDAGYVAIADFYERNNNREKALEYLNKALTSQPDSAKTMMMLAGLYSKMNRDKDAIPLYRKILQTTGDNAAVKKELASSLVDVGETEEAKRLLDEVTKANPSDWESRVLLGKAQLGSRNFKEAIDTFKAVLEVFPDHTEAQFYLANAYEQTGDPAEAAKIYAQLLERTKGNSEDQKANRIIFQQRLASTYQDMGENDKTIGILEEIVKNEAEPNPRILFLLINSYRISRQYDKALSLGKQQYQKRPEDTNMALVYARALADAGKTKEGAEILNKRLPRDSSNLDIYINLSQIYLQAKKFNDAEKIIKRAEEKKLDSERLMFQLATIYERQKDFDRAESLFKNVLKSNPKNANALNYIGYMLADRGVRLQEAVQYVEQALTIEPNNGAYLDSLGWAFFKMDNLEKAEKYLLQAVGLVKNDPVIHDHLGDLYFKAGDFKKAQDCWNKSLSSGIEQDDVQKVREKLLKVQELLRKQKSSQ